MNYNLQDIKKWIKEGQAISPRVAKDLIEEIGQLERKLSMATEFCLWLTPCGEQEKNPLHSIIGSEARDIYKRLTDQNYEKENENDAMPKMRSALNSSRD